MVGVETIDLDGAAAVELNDLVLSVEGSSADDVGVVVGSGLLEGDGVFADILPPDILDRARYYL